MVLRDTVRTWSELVNIRRCESCLSACATTVQGGMCSIYVDGDHCTQKYNRHKGCHNVVENRKPEIDTRVLLFVQKEINRAASIVTGQK